MEDIINNTRTEKMPCCPARSIGIQGSKTAAGGPFEPEYFNGIVSKNLAITNQTVWELPLSMRFNDAHFISIVVYSILMVFSAVGNTTVLVTICRYQRKSRLSRINLFLLHLTAADLLVTFLLMPLEIAWNWTVSWRAGDGMCRVMAFFRTFGLYLSGFMVTCISLDRYFAVLKPMQIFKAADRGRILLAVAWIGAVICSVPQALVFHVERHPNATWFEQCVTFHSFPTPQSELLYVIFGFFFLYGLPFAMIVGCYLCILWKLCTAEKNGSRENLSRSSTELLRRAKVKTLKLTLTIVTTFCLCWTPYNIMTVWYMVDRQSAEGVDQRVQKGLFLFACTNSCFNPLVYGFFHLRRKSEGTLLQQDRVRGNICKLRMVRKPEEGIELRRLRNPPQPSSSTEQSAISMRRVCQLRRNLSRPEFELIFKQNLPHQGSATLSFQNERRK